MPNSIYYNLFVIVLVAKSCLTLKNLPANAGDAKDEGSITGLGRFPGVGHGNSLQYFCMGNHMDRGS